MRAAAGFRSLSMKIGSFDNNGNKPLVPAGGHAAAAATDKPAGAAAAPEASAKVALSSAASVLVSEANADFDTEKVARIAQAIRDGKFAVNPEAIADKLIASANELLVGQKH
jgi:negative regulator of flagellin synthesis FlgM